MTESMNAFTPEQRAAVCEALISQTMQFMDVPRPVALVALGIRDMKRIQHGLETQIEGINFQTDFDHESNDGFSLHEDDVAKVVMFIEGVDQEEAVRRVRERIANGVFKAETKH